MSTTLDVYAVGDGGIYVYPAAGVSFATARALSVGGGLAQGPAVTTEDTNLSSSYYVTNRYIIWRNWFSFNTAAIGATSTITAASFFQHYGAAPTNANSTNSRLVAGTQASTASLAVEDFDQIGTTEFGNCSWGTNEYKEIALNGDGLLAVSKTDYTKLSVITGRDFDNAAPTGYNYPNIAFSGYLGTDHDPYLSVTYTAASTVNPTISYSPTASTGGGGAMGV